MVYTMSMHPTRRFAPPLQRRPSASSPLAALARVLRTTTGELFEDDSPVERCGTQTDRHRVHSTLRPIRAPRLTPIDKLPVKRSRSGRTLLFRLDLRESCAGAHARSTRCSHDRLPRPGSGSTARPACSLSSHYCSTCWTRSTIFYEHLRERSLKSLLIHENTESRLLFSRNGIAE
jgi:hypothetical protein